MWEKNENKQKEAEFGPFFKKDHSKWSSDRLAMELSVVGDEGSYLPKKWGYYYGYAMSKLYGIWSTIFDWTKGRH